MSSGPVNAIDALAEFVIQFECTLNAEEWNRLAELQAQLQPLVESAAGGLHGDPEIRQYRALLQKLAALVEAASGPAVAARDAAGEQLRQLVAGRSAAVRYREFMQD